MIKTGSSSTLGTRICLAGEGLGLYGGKAITMPINSFFTSVKVTEINLPNFTTSSPDKEDELNVVVSAVQKAFIAKDLYPDGFHLSLDASVPTGYGLASSATLYACIVQALNTAFTYNLTLDEIASIAYRAEHEINGILVGKTDTHAILHREVLLQDYERSIPIFTRLNNFPDNTAIVIIGDKPSLYASTGSSLKERMEKGEEGIMKYGQSVSLLVPKLAQAWNANDREAISLLTQKLFQSVCHDLNVGNMDYLRMVDTALSSGAYGAKNIGLRPNGGCIYALCDTSKVSELVNSFKNKCSFIKVLRAENIQ